MTKRRSNKLKVKFKKKCKHARDRQLTTYAAVFAQFYGYMPIFDSFQLMEYSDICLLYALEKQSN